MTRRTPPSSGILSSAWTRPTGSSTRPPNWRLRYRGRRHDFPDTDSRLCRAAWPATRRERHPATVPGVDAGAVSCPETSWDAIATAGDNVFSMWNGTIISTAYVSQGDFNGTGDVETRLRVVFTVSGAGEIDALLSWGGHIAREADWGTGQGATGINGSPYHMRLKGLCPGIAPPNLCEYRRQPGPVARQQRRVHPAGDSGCDDDAAQGGPQRGGRTVAACPWGQ